MKLLLIDNDSDTLIELRALCDRLGYDVVTLHRSNLIGCNSADYGLIVLSGGFWYDDELEHLANYKDELDIIRKTPTPILGICLGMQLMHVAFSGHVPLLEVSQSGAHTISLTTEGQQVLGLPEHITVHKNHTRGIISALEHFHVLGLSKGHLEIMRHRSQPLMGVQFHPEIGTMEESEQLMRALVTATFGRSGHKSTE